MLKIWLLEANFPRSDTIRRKLCYKFSQSPVFEVIATLDTLSRCLRIAAATKTQPDIIVVLGPLPNNYYPHGLGSQQASIKQAMDLLAQDPATAGVPVLTFTDQPEAEVEVREIRVKTHIKADGDLSFVALAGAIQLLTAPPQ